MIQIERLQMHLPPGFEHRATHIARLVGEILASQHLPQAQALDAVSLTTQRIPLQSSDAEVAGIIVRDLLREIKGRTA
jgi:hypothetical protein